MNYFGLCLEISHLVTFGEAFLLLLLARLQAEVGLHVLAIIHITEEEQRRSFVSERENNVYMLPLQRFCNDGRIRSRSIGTLSKRSATYPFNWSRDYVSTNSVASVFNPLIHSLWPVCFHSFISSAIAPIFAKYLSNILLQKLLSSNRFFLQEEIPTKEN